MAGLLDGIEGFGLGNLGDMNLYEKPKQKEATAIEVKKQPVVQETSFLFEKTLECPVCDSQFKSKTVKSGKARLIGTDEDLRPKYDAIDTLKYDVLVCPICGYAALSRYFKFVTSVQRAKIREAISQKFIAKPEPAETYSYEFALERYKLALVNAIVKQAKASEKAYICLKTAWLLRGKKENLDQAAPNYQSQKDETEKGEMEFLKNAYDGFLAARQTEGYPMCGMDEITIDFLIAVTAFRFEQYDVSAKLVSNILVSNIANARMKDRSRDLKAKLVKEIKRRQAEKAL